jgi:DNA invertase Pin-like site-specific DNA recombinase
MITIFGALAELERETILQRQAEGIAAAKIAGKRFGRPALTLPIKLCRCDIQMDERSNNCHTGYAET